MSDDKKLTAAKFKRVPLAEITTPRDFTEVRCGWWWSVTEDNEVLFYTFRRAATPQCNKDRRVVDHLATLYDFPTRTVQIEAAYLTPRY